MKHASVWAGVILSCAGCSSAPIHYYTLSAPAHVPIETQSTALSLDVSKTRMPSQADRRQLVVRVGDDEMQILDNEEWASALGNEVSSAVLFEIAAQLAQAEPRIVQNVKAMSLRLDVTRFEAVMNRYDTLSATWRLKLTTKDTTIEQSCPFGVLLPIAQGISGIVAGYQHAIAALAKDVVASVADSSESDALRCPGNAI